MKTNKPLLVKLSASLLVACGVGLPSLESSAEWTEDGGNWILKNSSARTEAVELRGSYSATLSSGSQWNKYIPTENSAAIIYTGHPGNINYLYLDGGSLVVNTPEGGPGLVYGVRNVYNDLMIESWASSSKVTVTNKYGDAIGIGTDDEDLVIGPYSITSPVEGGTVVPMDDVMSGTLTVTADGDATGLYSQYDLVFLGNLKGKLAATNNGLEGDAYGMQAASGDIVIQGDLSGTVAATASGDEAIALYAYDYLTIGGDLTGTVKATGNNYACGLYSSEESVSLNNLSGTITAKATGADYNADGIYAGNNIKIGNDLSGTITVTATNQASGLYAENLIYIDGNVSGKITATGADDGYAYGLYGYNGIDIDGDFSGKIVANAGDVYGAIYSYNGDVSMNDFTGSIAVTANCDGVGIYAGNDIQINNFSGSIVVNHTNLPGDDLVAYGLEAASGGIRIDGNFTGALTINGNCDSYGMSASDNISIGGDLGGKITVTDDSNNGGAYGLLAGSSIFIDGDLSTTMTVSATGYEGDAYGLYARNMLDIDGDFSGKITVTGDVYAAGMYADGDDVSMNDFTGSITVKSNYEVDGIYADQYIRMNNFSGKIAATASYYAGGMWADEEDLDIDGDFSGTVTVIGGHEAAGLYGEEYLDIGGDLSGKISVTATGYEGEDYTSAIGLEAGDEDLTIGGAMSGSVIANASVTQLVTVGPLPAGAAPGGFDSLSSSVYAGGFESCEYLSINNGLSGKVTATASNTMRVVVDRNSTDGFTLRPYAEADGFYAEMDILIQNNGGLTGSVIASAVSSVTNTSASGGASAAAYARAEAYGLYADHSIMILNGDLSGTVSATATATIERTLSGSTLSWAEALHADDSIFIAGDLSGKVSATADVATGLFAGILNDQSDESPSAAPVARPLPSDDETMKQLAIWNDLSGKVTATGKHFAMGVFAADDLTIGGKLSGTVTVTTTEGRAYGLGAVDYLTIGAPIMRPGPGVVPSGNPDILTGTVTVTAGNDAWGLFAGVPYGPDDEIGRIANDNGWDFYNYYPEGDLIINGNLTGTVTVTAGDEAYGLYADDDVTIYGNLSGKVTATGGYEAYGLYSNNLYIAGDLSGKVTAIATDDDAYGLYVNKQLIIGGDLSGTVTATGGYEAYGLYSDDDIYIGGDLSGKVTATAPWYAAGLYAEGEDDGMDIHGDLSGTVTATAVVDYSDSGSYYVSADGLYADEDITIGGSLSGSVSAKATLSNILQLGASASGDYLTYSMASANGLDTDCCGITIGGSLSGKITVTTDAKSLIMVNSKALPNVLVHSAAWAYADGLDSDGSIVITGESDLRGHLSGTVTVSATATANDEVFAIANGLSAEENIRIAGNLSGTVTVSATAKATGADGVAGAWASGLSGSGIAIEGNLSGKISVTTSVSADNEMENSAYGIYSNDYLYVGGDLSGTVTATSDGYAVGLFTNNNNNIMISGNLSGAITATGGYEAIGLKADDGLFIGRDFTGTVTVTGGGNTPENVRLTSDNYGMRAYSSIRIGSMIYGDVVIPPSEGSPGPDIGGENGIGIIGGNFSGSVTVKATGYGAGLSANGDGGDIEILRSITSTGKVTVTATDGAVGLDAEDITIGTQLIPQVYSPAGAEGYQPPLLDGLVFGGDMAGSITVTDTGNNAAFGMRADDQISILGNLSGTITVKAGEAAFGLYGGDNSRPPSPVEAAPISQQVHGGIAIGGDLSGKVTVTAGGWAGGLIADDQDVTMNNLSGTITVTGGDYGAAGISAREDVRINNLSGKIITKSDSETNGIYSGFGNIFIGGNLSGTVTTTSTANGGAHGLIAEDGSIFMEGDLSGAVTTTSTTYAYGLCANGGMLDIDGNLSGKVTATGDEHACALVGRNDLNIEKNLSGKVTATSKNGAAYGLQSYNGNIRIDGALSGAIAATGNEAYGISSDGDVSIANGLTGSITATAKYFVHGIHAGGRIDDGDGGPLKITGSIKVSGDAFENDTDNVKAIIAHGGMNLWIAGTVSATSKTGEAYAIKGMGSANDQVELTTGAKLTGDIDLGGDTSDASPGALVAPNGHSYEGDTLIVSGHGSYDAKGVAIYDVENLVVNADNTGWQLGGLNSNGYFNSITLNKGVFGFGTKEFVHVSTYSFYQDEASTLLIKLNNDNSDTVTILSGGSYSQNGAVRFVKFGGGSRTSCTWLIDESGSSAPPMSVKVAPSALFDSTVTSETTESGATVYTANVTRRSLAPMASSGNEGIAGALDQAFDNNEGSAALTGLAMMAAPEKIDSCLSSYQPISATTYATLSGSQSFSAGVGSHLQAIRQGMTMASSPVKANLPSLAGTGDTAVGEVLQAARAAASETTEWQVSGRYLGDFGRLNSDGVAAGNRWKTNGFMINLDRQINTNLVIGAAAGGSWSYIDINHDSGDAETTSLNARLYAAWFDGPWHVDALAGYGRNWNESRRHMAFLGETAKADWNSDVYTARLGGGYDLELGDGWIVEPNAAAEYTRIQNDSYNEHGSSTNLSVDGNNFDSLRHLLGVALRKGFTLDNKMVIRPEARLTWAHEYMDTTVRTSASLFGGSFTTNGVKQARDSAIIGLGLNLQFNETVGGYVSYDAELSNDKKSQGVSVGIRLNF